MAGGRHEPPRKPAVLAAWVLGGALLLLAPGQSAAQPCFSGADCDDDNPCTSDTCIVGFCSNGFACGDGDQCTNDICDMANGACSHTARLGEACEDFNPFTFDSRCQQGCPGPLDLVCVQSTGPAACQCDLQCPSGALCLGGVCIVQPTRTATRTATRTRTRTPTPFGTPTRTRTPTPDLRPAVEIQDASVTELDRDVSVSFIIVLSEPLDHPVTFGVTTSAGSATKDVDYQILTGNGVTITNETDTISFGTVTIPANTMATGQLTYLIEGDNLLELSETFFVSLTTGVDFRGADTNAMCTIIDDDTPLLPERRVGLAELTPRTGRTRVGRHTALVLSWTHPERWRDLDTVDLRLRGPEGIALWLRFAEADNTVALVDPVDGSAGAVVELGGSEDLAAAAASLVARESGRQASGPDAPRVELTFTLRFATADRDRTYQVEAAATDDSGEVQDFEEVGTLRVAALPYCPGDCDTDEVVTINELVLGVRIAAGAVGVDACRAFDTDAGGAVSIDELIAGVGAALQGCAA